MATRRRKDSGVLHIFIQMGVLVVLIVVCATLIWGDFGKDKPDVQLSNPPVENTEPPQINTSPVDTLPPETVADSSPEGIFDTFLKENNLTREDYTERQLTAYNASPEARSFVMSIPLEKDKEHIADISGFDRTNGVPLMMQWDERWGYYEYAYDLGGITGCGPTCLSMVAYYLTGNTEYTPTYMMDFSTRNGCVGNSGGTQWTLFSQAAPKLGLKVKEVILDKNAIIKQLDQGHPVVINVGAGDFTTSGHYLVIVSYSEGFFKVNDPNSVANSQRKWSYEQLEGQIKNLWAFSVPEEN